MENVFVPIYEKGGNEFFFLTEDMAGGTRLEAMDAAANQQQVLALGGIGGPLRYEEIDTKNTPHAEAVLSLSLFGEDDEAPVAIISGPLFDKAKAP